MVLLGVAWWLVGVAMVLQGVAMVLHGGCYGFTRWLLWCCLVLLWRC